MIPRRALSADIAFAILMIMAVGAAIVGGTYVIQREKNIALNDAVERSALHARAFEEHVNRNLETIRKLVDFLAAESDSELIHVHYQLALLQLPFLRSLSLLDESGRIVASSSGGNIGRQVAIEDYFPPPDSTAAASLSIGLPWAGRDFADGHQVSTTNPLPAEGLGFIPILCRSYANGREVRMVASLNPATMRAYFSQWLPPAEGFAEVLRRDGVLLLTSGKTSLTGAHQGGLELTRRLRQTETGRYPAEQEGGRKTVAVFRATLPYPLAVVSHLYRDQALAGWRQEIGRLLWLGTPALLGILSLATVFYRRVRRIAAEREAARRRAYERLAATVFETVLEAVVVTDGQQRIVAVNPAFTRITGYSADEATGRNLGLLASGYHTEEFIRSMRQELAAQGRWEGEVRNRRKNGEIFVVWQSVSQVRDDNGRVVHEVVGLSDITDYCAEADRISHLAHHDLLTGLPNRALLLDRLRQEIHQVRREDRHVVLLFFDLDKFKPVNDQLGHTVGDRLLQMLAARLGQEVRSGDTLARLGGDEFVMVLHAVKNVRAGVVVAEKVRQAVEQPFWIDGHRVTVSASIGIALYPDHASDEEQLLSYADKAMYQAKAKGGNCFAVWQGDDGA
ncbi:diguanylate cyclase domain-containing protein [Desulfobulbus sp.]|uniref:diguanylate cyclase domain-containing protein n=1 Tax=Desulfobulbus sp. TaxID=895 RepID=UPI00286F2037|nr:diguanylate cyclase [Desulfobulbus sp.]